MAVEAMRAGAVDFIEKPFEEERLLAALDTARAAMASNDAAHAERLEIARRLQTLSGRERDVLEGLIAGRANKVIAHDLGISARTVEIYRANLMTKMKASSLSELVRMALAVRS
jgi:two-component system response regulator FixJ